MFNTAGDKQGYFATTDSTASSQYVASERSTYVTTPGILINDREFKDSGLYGAITKCDSNFTGEGISSNGYGVFGVKSESGYTYYLLAKGAGNSATLTYTFADSSNDTDTSADSSNKTVLTGISYLTGTTSFEFENCNISTLEPFSLFTVANNSVDKLVLKNCGLGDSAKVWKDGTSYLYSLNRLTYCDLSGNEGLDIGDANSKTTIVYRTVQELYLNDNSIKDISKLNGLTALKVLNISKNKIADFSPLINLSALTTVYLYGNESYLTDNLDNDISYYYGTDGVLNTPVYVALNDMGVTIYKEEGAYLVFGEGGITATEQELARALNAIAYGTKQKDNISFATTLVDNSENATVTYSVNAVAIFTIDASTVTTYTVKNCNSDSSSVTDKDTYAPAESLPGGEIYLIVSVTNDGKTVYSQYKMTYTKS
jgi:hypothetical protein